MASPHTIIFAETIHTFGDESSCNAVGITDGIITHLGSRQDAARWAGARTEMVDHGNATITPGLVDAHIHPVFGQQVARGIFFGNVTTVEEASELISKSASETTEADVILGYGLNQAIFGENEPHGAWLEDAAPGRKCYVTCFDAHSAIASAAMLEAANVTGAERFEDSSTVVLGPTGKPTGFLREFGAMQLIEKALPELSIEEKVESVYKLLRGMAATGLTGGEMLDFADPDSLEIFRRIEQRGDMPIRLRIAPWIMASDGIETLERLKAMQGLHGRRWQVRGVKLMIDGTIDNGTAWLYEPDTEGECTESLYMDPDQYRRNLLQFSEAGIATTTHAIGDQGIGFVIRSISELPTHKLKHRIEHLEEINDDDMKALAISGATVSMQPTHCTHFVRADGSDAWSRRLGKRRASFAFRLRDVKDAGLVLALGSDWPIAPYDPRRIMADAQTRRRTEVPDGDSVQPRHKLTALEALEGYTVNVYSSSGAEGGQIALGAMADMTVFASDPLKISPEELSRVPVLATYIDGRKVDTGVGLAPADTDVSA